MEQSHPKNSKHSFTLGVQIAQKDSKKDVVTAAG